ncbi:glycosyltransferase family 2 protein [Oscillatoriales cyanobacterium LEGE 11467]|uniref:Beta-monoglucosyldiacylglycerol synthase n=1 Tax=Zarconia navalis LEGE 11467 TaxID=1828826 RepID=A0A928Z7Y2_9CYAN|nr:glycosyltransferase family 2 protein [Zarconia navalis]MBE9039251.1 glycosyltransferase family 2 protein [Zarconia navalis LEGE 11467]
MRANSWEDDNSAREFEPLASILFGQTHQKEESIDSSMVSAVSYRGYAGRRRKAAMVLTTIWLGTILLYFLPWGSALVLGLTSVLGFHTVRFFLLAPKSTIKSLPPEERSEWPSISVLVAAKNEEAVIGSLVERLCHLNYPVDRYEVWIIDDNSSDGTAAVLKELVGKYDRLNVLHRTADACGGKSGALNQALKLATGEILAVFDADARVSPDLLRQVIPQFDRPRIGAVQLRKVISNAGRNFWTRGQATEMIFDAFLQQQRHATGGIGELRGNGQFVRRKALASCGYFNEETITDDLDLTLRLHLDGWDIDCAFFPTVGEEGVTDAVSLWHQRSRWAEGGYQRYLDYWRLISRNRMGWGKTMDTGVFFITMYLLPTAAVPDLLMAIVCRQMPMLTPITSLTVFVSVTGMWLGLRQVRRGESQPLHLGQTLWQILQGALYMLHWFAVMAATTARVSVRPKRLKWVKTVHQGH